jgi:hypothetical protein
VALALIAVTSQAQPGPRAEWSQHLDTGQTLQGAIYSWQVDNGPFAVLAHTCTAQVPDVQCSAPLTAAQAPAGSHKYTLQLATPFGQAATTQTGAPPNAPGGFRIITVTVTIATPGAADAAGKR